MIAHAAAREISGVAGPLELGDNVTGLRVHRSEKIGSTSATFGRRRMGLMPVKEIERAARQTPEQIQREEGERKRDGMVLVDAEQREET